MAGGGRGDDEEREELTMHGFCLTVVRNYSFARLFIFYSGLSSHYYIPVFPRFFSSQAIKQPCIPQTCRCSLFIVCIRLLIELTLRTLQYTQRVNSPCIRHPGSTVYEARRWPCYVMRILPCTIFNGVQLLLGPNSVRLKPPVYHGKADDAIKLCIVMLLSVTRV